MKRSHRFTDSVKRITDVIVSAIALVLLGPVLAVIALMVGLDVGAPVLFAQPRPGRDGKVFTMYKFRTMRTLAKAATLEERVASDEARITKLGRFLRSTSLDELPELWNVLIGDMSLVGPRPLLPEYLDRYNQHQARRHEVRPGITGWAQVNGRNATTWEERFDMDVYYVDHRSIGMDARILLKTVATVLSRKDVTAEGAVTMEPFEGSESDGLRCRD